MITVLTRRSLLRSLPPLTLLGAAGSKLIAQTGKPPGIKGKLAARKLSQLTLIVSDLGRSLEFYQGLFGMPIQARQGSAVLLRIGTGPQYLALVPAAGNAKPGYSHFGLSIDHFNPDQTIKVLAEYGVTESDGSADGLSGGAMKVRRKMRGPDAGGARDGTPDLFLGDPDGVVIQLQDPSYCGGAGALGNVCRAPEPAPRKGLLAVTDLSHFTLFVSDAQRSQTFYQDLFGLFIQAHQGPTAPIWGVGSGPGFLMLAGVAGRGGAGSVPGAPRGNINHSCLFMEGFNPDSVLKTLADFGLKPRGSAGGPAPPLVSYVTLRMENRGGAKDGTPELYFTDPDGILLQLQDVTYCGGAGHLGELCA
jgi:catechol 2,3-dioxygenase-like lactoylglutathione lyase family enzyme